MKARRRTRSPWTLRTARPGDLNAVRDLLGVCELPLGGLDDQFGERYVIAEKDGDVVGVAGMEIHGPHGLLRSVGVVPWMRGSGLGRELVHERIEWAKGLGIRSIYLLTMTAENYFKRHGFVTIGRGESPAEIRASQEFDELCPASAVFMRFAGEGASQPEPVSTAQPASNPCCASAEDEAVSTDDPEAIRTYVRERYGRAARRAQDGNNACCGGSCGTENAITSNLYEAHELEGIPEEVVRASLGCGNPTLLAELHEGETVLDLGSGGGIDVLLSARRVGPTGKAYGLDMTDEMLELARENQKKAGVTNVEFLKGQIEEMPLPDASVDVIISNCVINLSADKRRVLHEAFRVLRPGGRFAVSDVVVRQEIPADVRRHAELWAGCVAGALEEWTYRDLLREAGFDQIEVVPTRIYSAEDSGVLDAGLRFDEATLKSLDGAFMSAFVRAKKP